MQLFITRGLPAHIRSDNGLRFVAEKVRGWLQRLELGPLYIEPGSPWENGYCESCNGKLRDELLRGELFDTLKEARWKMERTFAWLANCRRLVVRYRNEFHVYSAFFHLACIMVVRRTLLTGF